MAVVAGDAWGRDTDMSWSIRTCAEVSGVPRSTLRTWEKRYGLGPSARTEGGHRRYTGADLDRVRLMCALLDRGAPAAEAARQACIGTDAQAQRSLAVLLPEAS